MPPQKLGSSTSKIRLPMILSEAGRTITRRSFNTGLHTRYKERILASAQTSHIGREIYEYWSSCVYPRFLLQHPLSVSTPDTTFISSPPCYTTLLLNSPPLHTYIYCENRSLRPWPVLRVGGGNVYNPLRF